MNSNLRQITALLGFVSVVWLVLLFVREAHIPRADQIGGAAAFAGRLVLLAACVGVAAMATVQFWKVLFHPRADFHAEELRAIFGDRADQILGLAAPDAKDSDGQENSEWPVKPPSPSPLLDTPTEVVMGQIRSTADYILLRPAGFKLAIAKLAGPAGVAAAQSYIAATATHAANTNTQTKAETAAAVNEELVALRFFVEQHLNVVHATLRERWRLRVRTFGVVTAGAIGVVAVSIVKLDVVATLSVLAAAAIWGGFFSWLARDLVSLVERGRG